MEAVVKTTQILINTFAVLVNKLEGYPRLPTNQIGGGKHIFIDSQNPGIGWTLSYDVAFKHPTLTDWAFPIDQNIIDHSTDPDYTQNLSGAELSSLQADLATRVVLDSTWFPEIELI